MKDIGDESNRHVPSDAGYSDVEEKLFFNSIFNSFIQFTTKLKLKIPIKRNTKKMY